MIPLLLALICKFAFEVNAVQADAPVHVACVNQHSNCQIWADSGACDSNRDFMYGICTKSCHPDCKGGKTVAIEDQSVDQPAAQNQTVEGTDNGVEATTSGSASESSDASGASGFEQLASLFPGMSGMSGMGGMGGMGGGKHGGNKAPVAVAVAVAVGPINSGNRAGAHGHGHHHKGKGSEGSAENGTAAGGADGAGSSGGAGGAGGAGSSGGAGSAGGAGGAGGAPRGTAAPPTAGAGSGGSGSSRLAGPPTSSNATGGGASNAQEVHIPGFGPSAANGGPGFYEHITKEITINIPYGAPAPPQAQPAAALPSANANCADTNPYCAYWASIGQCSPLLSYACAKSCNPLCFSG